MQPGGVELEWRALSALRRRVAPPDSMLDLAGPFSTWRGIGPIFVRREVEKKSSRGFPGSRRVELGRTKVELEPRDRGLDFRDVERRPPEVALRRRAAVALAGRVDFCSRCSTRRRTGVVKFPARKSCKPAEDAFCPGRLPQEPGPVEKEGVMRKQWSVEEIMAALEAEVAVHRERSAHHAAQETFHREQRSHHEGALETASRRLEELRAVSTAALEIVGHLLPAAAPPDEGMDIGPASKPRLTLLLKTIVGELGPDQSFGPGWLADQVNRRYGNRLRRPVTSRQMSDVCRRLARAGGLRHVRVGKGRYESRFARVE